MKLWLLLLPSKRRLTKVWTSLLIAIYQAYMITFSYVTILSISYAQGVKKFMPKTAQPISKVQNFFFFTFSLLNFYILHFAHVHRHSRIILLISSLFSFHYSTKTLFCAFIIVVIVFLCLCRHWMGISPHSNMKRDLYEMKKMRVKEKAKEQKDYGWLFSFFMNTMHIALNDSSELFFKFNSSSLFFRIGKKHRTSRAIISHNFLYFAQQYNYFFHRYNFFLKTNKLKFWTLFKTAEEESCLFYIVHSNVMTKFTL